MSNQREESLWNIIIVLLKRLFEKDKRKKKKATLIQWVFPHLKIKGVFMATIIKKKQFNKVFDTDGVTLLALIVNGHIVPKDDANDVEKVQNGTIVYTSSNLGVATVTADPNDPTKFKLTWVGAGDVQITSNANADLDPNGPVDTVSGSLDLTLLEDEATTLSMLLDDVQPDVTATAPAASTDTQTQP